MPIQFVIASLFSIIASSTKQSMCKLAQNLDCFTLFAMTIWNWHTMTVYDAVLSGHYALLTTHHYQNRCLFDTRFFGPSLR